MYSLYVLATLQKSWKVVADFYDELYGEMKDRVSRGIAAIENEQFRLMTDSQPPWGFLKIFRYLEEYGAVSIGSLYTFGLEGMWTYDRDKGTFKPKHMPDHKPKDREEACRMLAEWHLHKPGYQTFYDSICKSELVACVARNWKVNAIILHYNRGCEGSSLYIAEMRLYLLEKGFHVMTYEGNMGDEREFDEPKTIARIDTLMELVGLKATKLKNGNN